jgi:hypothetical protein
MYGLVLMVAVSGSGDTAAFGKRNQGCHGDVPVVVAPACPTPAPVYCCPEPARKGLFARLKKSKSAPACCPSHTTVTCSTCATPCCALPPAPAPAPATPDMAVPKPMDPKPGDKKKD